MNDSLEYKNNKLYINGKFVEEEYDRRETSDFILEFLGENTIPKDKYLVLGDNRPISKDSRIIGLVDKKDIEGYTSLVLFPFSKFGNVE